MSQTPPNSGWQPGSQPPQQPWSPSGGPGQPPSQPGYQPGQPNVGQPYPQNQPGYRPQGQPGYGPQGQPGYPQNQPGYGPQGQPGFDQTRPGYATQTEPARKKSKVPAIVAGVVALALIVGGVVFGLSFLRGASVAATKALPADVDAVLELNLSPAVADQLALKEIVEKFPEGNLEEAGTDYKKALFTLVAGSDPDAPDYDTEIGPWLGDSIAVGILDVAAVESNDGVVVAFETTDKGKAEAFAEEHLKFSNVFFIDNVLVATDDTTLSADSISAGSVADDDTYKADMAELGDSSLASGWFGPQAVEALLGEAEATSGLDTSQIDALRGAHGAFGLQVTDDMLTVKVAMQAPNAPVTTGNVADLVRGLPGDSVAVIGAATTDDAFTQLWTLAEAESDVVDMLAELGITGADDLAALIGTEAGFSLNVDDNQPVIGAVLNSDDPARQKEILENLDELLAQSPEARVSIGQEEGTGYIAIGQDLTAVTAPATKIGDVDSFKKVVEGDATGIVFLNVNAALALPSVASMLDDGAPETRAWLEPVESVGIVGTTVGDYTHSVVRVTFN